MTKLLTDKPINEFPNRQGIAAGDFISSADMNACLDAMGERTNYLYTMGIYPHNTAFAYPIGAFCQVSGAVYRATVANTGKPPASNPSFWVKCPMTAAEISAALNFVTALNGKQDADNTLTALANLATSADKMIYATGADQFALTPLTAFIRTLLDDGDADAARVTLGAAADNHGHATSQITGLDGALGDRYTKAEANNLLAAKINKAGDTMTGQLTFKGGTLEAGGGFNSAADNDSGMDFPADGHVRLRSNARVAVEALPDGTVKTWYGGNNIACQPDGHMVVYDTNSATKHVFWGNGSYTATGNIESQASIYGRGVIAKQTAIICNRNNESQQWHIFSDNDRDLKFYSTVAGDTVGYINREGKIYTTGYGWLHDKFTPPAGMVSIFAGETVPTGWLKCNGALLSRTTYAALFAVIGTTYGAGDGSTTFALPDLRGEFVRGFDDGRGIDAGRALGSWRNHILQSHNHFLPTSTDAPGGAAAIPDHLWTGGTAANYHARDEWSPSTTYPNPLFFSGAEVGNIGNFGGETAPRSIAMHYIIKF